MFYRLMLPFTTACLLAACGQNVRQPEMPPLAAQPAELTFADMMSAPLPAKPHKKSCV